tara:strand:- start:2045 stop:2506 length:462 start_codon:yes stop_codon:yes gene_type:complete
VVDNILIIQINDKKYYYPPKAGVIIMNRAQTKLLIVKNKNDTEASKWGLPKGHVEKGETLTECAERELLEETGVALKILPSDPYIKINNSMYYIYWTEDTTLLTIAPRDKEEIEDARFCYINRIHSLRVNRELKTILKKKLKKLKRFAKKISI